MLSVVARSSVGAVVVERGVVQIEKRHGVDLSARLPYRSVGDGEREVVDRVRLSELVVLGDPERSAVDGNAEVRAGKVSNRRFLRALEIRFGI